MYFREFDAEIRKGEIEETKPLHDLGNFFIRYYLAKTRLWVAVVIADRGYVKGYVIVSSSYLKRPKSTINITPIKPFSEIIKRHTETVIDKGPAIPIPDYLVESYAKAGLIELFEELKIVVLPKITRIKSKKDKDRFALPDEDIVERVARGRAKILCPNCEEAYLHFKGKVEGRAIITCKYCEISYYKKL